jgi:hypothetical protein
LFGDSTQLLACNNGSESIKLGATAAPSMSLRDISKMSLRDMEVRRQKSQDRMKDWRGDLGDMDRLRERLTGLLTAETRRRGEETREK